MIFGSVIVQSIGFGVVTAAIVAIGAMGFTLQFGVTNVLNISYGNILTVGAFASLLVEDAHLGLAAVIVVAPIAGAVVTFVLARTLFALFARRSAGTFDLIMVSLAASLIIQFSIDAADQGQEFAFTFPSGATLHPGPFVFTTESLALVGVAIFVYLVLLRCAASDADRDRATGALDRPEAGSRLRRAVRPIVNLTWIISGALGGLAGLIYVTNSLTVSADSGLNFLVLVIAAALLGGAGSPTGAAIASLVVGIATEVVAAVGGSYYSQAVGLGILAVVLIARPSSRAVAGVTRNEVTV